LAGELVLGQEFFTVRLYATGIVSAVKHATT